MQPSPTPANDGERVAALHALNLLGGATEERFDRLARLAKRLFNVPIAKVTLVDTETVFALSCVGTVPVPLPREVSFCSHTILTDSALVIEDALLDERFHDNPHVAGAPHIRFYAGYPLTLPNGFKLGALCLVDMVARTFTDEDRALLRDLAGMVEQEMAAVQMATTDVLTQLSNRRGFELLGEQALHVCKRLRMPAALLFFDLNGFKQINDVHGHAEGDRALAVFAEVLRTVFRHSDLIARLGGDEFATLLINSDPRETAVAIARLRTAVAARNAQEGRGYEIAFSVGQVDLDAARHGGIGSLLADGDAAMYRDKPTRAH